MSGLGFIRRMFWSCIGWCDLGWLLGRFWAIGAALDGWEVMVAVGLLLVKGR